MGHAQGSGSVEWWERAFRRCTTALSRSVATADRLALLRSLIRLNDGHINLAAEQLTLSIEERLELTRFGLTATGNGGVRLLDEPDNPIPGLNSALRIDRATRRLTSPAVADAVLLRLTEFAAYSSDAQKSAIRALLMQPPGSGLLVSMPTGSGKSLLFQAAALFERKRSPSSCVAVITPTIALALDHESTLKKIEGLVGSRALIGGASLEEETETINAFRRGEVPILLLSPEKALSGRVREALLESAGVGERPFGAEANLTHLFVDEAHIVESWGRRFRPDFQRLPALLSDLRQGNPSVRAVLLSATLPASAIEVLRAGWRQEKPWLEVQAKVPRYDYDLIVQSFTSEDARDLALDIVIDRAPRPSIVYTTEVRAARRVFDHIVNELGYARVALFTGDTQRADRDEILRQWKQDELDIVVATSAFGMGIDKPDVRSIIHACLPETPSRWYQEIGRASRDGGQSLAVCLFTQAPNGGDVRQAYRLATGDWLSRDLAEKRWRALVDSARDVVWVGSRRRMTLDLDAVRLGLSPEQYDFNRGWNCALLTLMQRAGLIEVLPLSAQSDGEAHHWQIDVLELDLLGADFGSVWARLSDCRERERSVAQSELDAFSSLMIDPDATCVLRRVFENLEPGAMAPPCGRCPACRRTSVNTPARVVCHGMERAWDVSCDRPSPLPPGVHLLSPDDPRFDEGLQKLTAKLVELGVEQFVAPRSLCDRIAGHLEPLACDLGLVVPDDGVDERVRLARTHTAIILSDSDETARHVKHSVASYAELWPEILYVIVADPSREIAGRRIDQTVRFAPILERDLERIIGLGKTS